MGEASETSPSEAPSARRWVRIETALAVAGALVAGGFVLPWLDGSGLDVALRGGLWSGVFAIPALALITAVLGALGVRVARYAAMGTALAMLVSALVAVAGSWPWLYTIPLAVGVVAIAFGVLNRVTVAAPFLGLAILAAVGVAVLLRPEAALFPDKGAGLFGLPTVLAIPLLVLAAVLVAAAGLLLVAALRKKGHDRALVFAGLAIVATAIYGAALDVYSAALASAGIGLWMTAAGGLALLLASRPRAGAAAPRASKKAEKTKKAKKAKKPKATKAKAEADKPEPAAEPEAAPSASKPAPSTAAPAADSEADKAAAEKQAKIAKLKKLKRLKALKEAEAREKAAVDEAKAAEAEEAATAKAGEALANEPEPTFASDPSAKPPPEDEDRDALMKRVGVKKPPPPSDDDLEAMLAALKTRAADDED